MVKLFLILVFVATVWGGFFGIKEVRAQLVIGYDIYKTCYAINPVNPGHVGCDSPTNEVVFQVTGPTTDIRGNYLACMNSTLSTSSQGSVNVDTYPGQWSGANCKLIRDYVASSSPYDVSASTTVCYIDPNAHLCVQNPANQPAFGSITIEPVSSPTPPPPPPPGPPPPGPPPPPPGPPPPGPPPPPPTPTPTPAPSTVFCANGMAQRYSCECPDSGHQDAPTPACNGWPGCSVTPYCPAGPTYPAPKPTATVVTSSNCINPNDGGGDIFVSWSPTSPNIQVLDASTDPNFGSFGHKAVPDTWTNIDANGMTDASTGAPFKFNPGNTYYFRVWNGYQDSPNSDPITPAACATPTPTPDTGPGVFSLTSATPGCSVAGPTVTLTWNPSSAATSYEIYRTSLGGSSSYFATVPAPQTTYTDTGSSPQESLLLPSTDYTYYVTAFNDTDSYSTNSLMVATLSCKPPQPRITTVSGCIRSNDPGGDIFVSWNATTPNVDYLDVSTPDMDFVPYANKTVPDGSIATYADSMHNWDGSLFTFNPGTTYFFRTFNGYDHSSTSAAFTATACDSTPPFLTVESGPFASCVTSEPGPNYWSGNVSGIAYDLPVSGGSGISSITAYLYNASGTPIAGFPAAYDGTTYWNTNIPSSYFSNGNAYFLEVYAQDRSSPPNVSSARVPISNFTWSDTEAGCQGPYLNTTGGDVHSNSKIDTEGGP